MENNKLFRDIKYNCRFKISEWGERFSYTDISLQIIRYRLQNRSKLRAAKTDYSPLVEPMDG